MSESPWTEMDPIYLELARERVAEDAEQAAWLWREAKRARRAESVRYFMRECRTA